MPVYVSWTQISIRLALTIFAGLVIGFNRSEEGRPAGMRTTLLVCLTGSLSVLLANLLINTRGKPIDSFVQLDLMRLPLGVLSGMGFIGAGTILRKGSLVVGITTAATLWFVTVLGMCFGAGQIGLGLTSLLIGVATLWGLKLIERHMRQRTRGKLTVRIAEDGPTESQLRELVIRDGCHITAWGSSFKRSPRFLEVRCEVQWQSRVGNTIPPAIVAALQANAGVSYLKWEPEGVSTDVEPQQTEPQGTPIPISMP